jgi:hypothetical protein
MTKACASWVACLLVATAACDTKQPTDAGTQTVSVTAQAFGLTEAIRIYNVWQDTDSDGNPDVDTGDKRCITTGNFVNAPAPWPYSASFSVIFAGTTQEVQIRSTTASSDPFTNLTPYDDQIRQNVSNLQTQGKCVGGTNNGNFCLSSTTCPGGSCGPRVWHFLAGREVTTTNLDYIQNCTSLGPQVGVANILGEVGSFDFEVSPGDTIVFRARKTLTVNSFPYATFLRLNNSVSMNSGFFIDGRRVTPDGDPNASDAEGAGYTASVRLR